jgi:hypothetical protein
MNKFITIYSGKNGAITIRKKNIRYLSVSGKCVFVITYTDNDQLAYKFQSEEYAMEIFTSITDELNEV